MAGNGGRTGPAWDRARAQALSQTDALGRVICAWCHQPIDMTLSGRHRMGPTADHVHEMQRGGPLFGQLEPMHKGCNSTKGNLTRQGRHDERPEGDGTTRDW